MEKQEYIIAFGWGIKEKDFSNRYGDIRVLIAHFKNRLSNEKWIIYDENKDKAVFYDTKDIRILEDIKLDFKNSEDEYEKMWKTFIKAVTIKERKNLRCQRNFMPKKYWKNLLEVNV